jgi:hypothetical protein
MKKSNIQVIISYQGKSRVQKVRLKTNIISYFTEAVIPTGLFYLTVRGRVIQKEERFDSEHNNQLFCLNVCDFGGSRIKPKEEKKKPVIIRIENQRRKLKNQIDIYGRYKL